MNKESSTTHITDRSPQNNLKTYVLKLFSVQTQSLKMSLVKILEHSVDSDTKEYKLETLQSEASKSEDTEEYATPGPTTKDSEHTHSKKPDQVMENITRMTEVEIGSDELGKSSRITNYLERKMFVEQIGEKLEEQLVMIHGYAWLQGILPTTPEKPSTYVRELQLERKKAMTLWDRCPRCLFLHSGECLVNLDNDPFPTTSTAMLYYQKMHTHTKKTCSKCMIIDQFSFGRDDVEVLLISLLDCGKQITMKPEGRWSILEEYDPVEEKVTTTSGPWNSVMEELSCT